METWHIAVATGRLVVQAVLVAAAVVVLATAADPQEGVSCAGQLLVGVGRLFGS